MKPGNPEDRYLSEPIENECVRGDVDPAFDLAGRTTWTVIDGTRTKVEVGEALVASSQTHDGMHRPALDIDIPARLVPSSTPGHSHLYLDVDLTWEKYRRLLEVLDEVGVIEKGYTYVAMEREATFVRLPWIKKKPIAGGTP